MAKGPARKNALPEPVEQAGQDGAGDMPLPYSGHLKTTTMQLKAGSVLYRVHQQQYAADQFNPGVAGNARFSPICNAAGEAIPTLYGGVTQDCAMMETVFHDVSFAPGLKTYDKTKLVGQVLSTLEVSEDLQLLDLASVPLRKLGISRKELINTEKDRYPGTRKWAEAFPKNFCGELGSKLT